MYTREFLNKIEPNTIFASGLSDIWNDTMFKWVAIRGGIDDWAIYIGKVNNSDREIAEFGEKVFCNTAKNLILGDEEFYNRYRK